VAGATDERFSGAAVFEARCQHDIEIDLGCQTDLLKRYRLLLRMGLFQFPGP
jgi:hypothetical protein